MVEKLVADKINVSGAEVIRIYNKVTELEDINQLSEASLQLVRENLKKAKCIYNCCETAKLY